MIEKTIDVFIETTEKCPICGFYKRICVCAENTHKKFSKLSPLKMYLKNLFAKISSLKIYKEYFKKFAEIIRFPKEHFKRFVAKDKMEYHRQMFNRFISKSDKAYEKAIRNYKIYRQIQESKIDGNNVKLKGINIKISKIDWGDLERNGIQTKKEGVTC